MADVELNITSVGTAGTEIQADADWEKNDYVFQADASPIAAVNAVDGVHGIGSRGTDGGMGGTGVRGFGGEDAGVGVRGKGGAQGDGVVGEGGTLGGRGVAGTGGPGWPGVWGQGSAGSSPADPAGPGVIGRGADVSAPDDPPLPSPTGVLGVSMAGVGVLGAAGGTAPPQVSDVSDTDVAGVLGYSDRGAGVLGVSDGGAAVIGKSQADRGGVFASDTLAQARLVPSRDARLPEHGRIGDLFAHMTSSHVGDVPPTVTLYLCVTDTPTVQWQRVQLDITLLPGGTPVP